MADFAPLSKPTRTTVGAGITLRGPVASDTREGGTARTRFIDHTRNVPVPALSPRDVMVIDNLAPHYAREASEAVGATVEPQPGPEPDRAEGAKMKGILRKARVRDTLVKAVDSILVHDIPAQNCVG